MQNLLGRWRLALLLLLLLALRLERDGEHHCVCARSVGMRDGDRADIPSPHPTPFVTMRTTPPPQTQALSIS